MADLYERLEALEKSDIYPFHMPGHKRNRKDHPLGEMFGIDITEIPGFDNLHHATGILKTMQDEAAQIYGTRQTFFLVNGSTCGIQAAVTASVRQGKKLLMARNCHKAVYHTCLLRGIETEYVYPASTDIPQIFGDIRAGDVERALSMHSDIDAVIITSPNYDGIVSDVFGIAEVVHAYGALLIVDEAHGAHLKFSPLFPKSALECGADIVIHSLHKTLPSLTQTALLHINSVRAQQLQIQKYLSMYQTSSPSYLFLSTMQQCIRQTNAGKEALFQTLSNRLDDFQRACQACRHFRILSADWAAENGIYDFDKSKILILPLKSCLSGGQLYEILRKRYHLQMEMDSVCYVMGIATICDTQEGFRRLAGAIREIDVEMERSRDRHLDVPEMAAFPVRRPGRVYTMQEAFGMPKEKRTFLEAAGRVSGEFVYLYPPGIPMIVPGERITEELAAFWIQCRDQGLPLQGLLDPACQWIEVVK